MAASTQEVIEMLKVSYNMELETVLNYLANSTNPDGVRAEEIKKSLAADITAELGHACANTDRCLSFSESSRLFKRKFCRRR